MRTLREVYPLTSRHILRALPPDLVQSLTPEMNLPASAVTTARAATNNLS